MAEGWGKNSMGFLCPLPLLPLGSREDKILHRTDYLTGADQNIPNWSIKMTYLKEAEIAVRSNIKSRFGIMGFSTSNTILGLCF